MEDLEKDDDRDDDDDLLLLLLDDAGRAAETDAEEHVFAQKRNSS